MELISLPDASRIAVVSVTTLRNYIRDKQLAAVFGPKRLTPQGVRTTALDLGRGRGYHNIPLLSPLRGVQYKWSAERQVGSDWNLS